MDKTIEKPRFRGNPPVSEAIGETPHICKFKLPAIIRLIQTGRLTYSNLIGLISLQQWHSSFGGLATPRQ